MPGGYGGGLGRLGMVEPAAFRSYSGRSPLSLRLVFRDTPMLPACMVAAPIVATSHVRYMLDTYWPGCSHLDSCCPMPRRCRSAGPALAVLQCSAARRAQHPDCVSAANTGVAIPNRFLTPLPCLTNMVTLLLDSLKTV